MFELKWYLPRTGSCRKVLEHKVVDVFWRKLAWRHIRHLWWAIFTIKRPRDFTCICSHIMSDLNIARYLRCTRRQQRLPPSAPCFILHHDATSRDLRAWFWYVNTSNGQSTFHWNSIHCSKACYWSWDSCYSNGTPKSLYYTWVQSSQLLMRMH